VQRLAFDPSVNVGLNHLRRLDIGGMTPEAVQCPYRLADRTKMFHAKHFGTIDGLGKRTLGARGMIQSRDLERAMECGKSYHFQ
jgi:hypothetical protein